jgi:DNA-binding CsgD family transcriptional regulator
MTAGTAASQPTHPDSEDSPLGGLGIGAESERAYRIVLQRPGLRLSALARSTGRVVADVRRDLEPLISLDLVRLNDDVVDPEPPSFALRKLLARESRRLAEAARSLEVVESVVHRYVREHRAAQVSGREPLTIDVIASSQLIDAIESLVPATTGEMLFLRIDKWNLVDTGPIDKLLVEAIRGGRSARVIYPVSVLERFDMLAERARAGEQIRIIPDVPSRMAVFGDSAVVLPEQWGDVNVGSALLLREPSVVTACRALFELMWTKGTAIPALHVDGNETGRRQLLELLAKGAKDEQISRTLGLSLRTVRRRVAAMMAELGADTRFVAGVEAARRGWL